MRMRNAKWVDAAHTAVDVEIEHPQFGWIPFSAMPGDPAGAEVLAAINAGAAGAVAPYVAPVKTAAQIQRELELVLDKHIDGVARSRGYDNRITCTMRAGYANPWQAEAIAFGQWMDACYVIGLGIANAVKAGTRAIPTEAELIAELPPMVWP